MSGDRSIHQCQKCMLKIVGQKAYIEHFDDCNDICWGYIKGKLECGDFDGAARDACSATKRAAEATLRYMKGNRNERMKALKDGLDTCDMLANVGYVANTIVRGGVRVGGTITGAACSVVAGLGAITSKVGQGISLIGDLIKALGKRTSDAESFGLNSISTKFEILGASLFVFGKSVSLIKQSIGELISGVGSAIKLAGQGVVTMGGCGIAKLGETLANGVTGLAKAAEYFIAESGASKEHLKQWGFGTFVATGAGSGATIGALGGPVGAAGGALVGGAIGTALFVGGKVVSWLENHL